MPRPPNTAIVLGAGFAGLAAALRLAQAGQQVTVLERLERPGGKAALGWNDFSSGPTVVTMPDVLRGLHRRLGLKVPVLSPASPTTTYHYAGNLAGRTFAPEALNVAGSLERTLAQLTPREGRAYTRLLGASRRMYQDAKSTFLFAPPPGAAQLARYALRSGLRAAPWASLHRFVQSGPLLTPFWLRFATYLGADPYRAPAVLHNVAWVELGLGVWHLGEGQRAGLGALAEQLAQEAQRLGVRFEYGVNVRHLIRLGGRVEGAHTNQGVFAASQWVSAFDRSFTAQLLGGPPDSSQRGASGFGVQLRLGRDMGRAHHLFFPERYRREWQDIRAGRWPSDPALYLHLDGARAFLLVNAPALRARRPEAPHPSPQQYAEQLLRQVQARFDLPVTDVLALPPETYALTGYLGALYGQAPHGLKGSLRPNWQHAAASNLVQVGGTVHPGGGVPLSLLSGWNGAGQLLKLPYDNLSSTLDGEA